MGLVRVRGRGRGRGRGKLWRLLLEVEAYLPPPYLVLIDLVSTASLPEAQVGRLLLEAEARLSRNRTPNPTPALASALTFQRRRLGGFSLRLRLGLAVIVPLTPPQP